MSENYKFEQAKEKYFKMLEQYVPIVARVHGNNHNEFHEVHKLFDTIINKTNDAGIKPNLDEEFKQLREITNDYKVPNDVCESYAAVYNTLSEVDKAYHS